MKEQEVLPEVTFIEMLQDQVFGSAYELAQRKTIDQITKLLQNYKYESYGVNMLMITHYAGNWNVGFRNPVDWKEPKLNCETGSLHHSLSKFYAWCVFKKYLK